MSKKSVLIVEDNKDISKMLADFLNENDYQVSCAYNGKEAVKAFENNRFDIILMDLMLPYISGEKLIEQFRKMSYVPVICISAKSAMDTRLEVLKMGADDYIVKPFDLNEVLVRMDVVLRRVGKDYEIAEDGKKEIVVNGLTWFREEKRISYDNKEISLTAKELKILELMLSNPDKIFSKANLYESVWEDVYYYEDNTINVHMSNLRKKLRKETGKEYIKTVWGIGYKLGGNE